LRNGSTEFAIAVDNSKATTYVRRRFCIMDLNPAQRQQAPEPPRRSVGADLFVLAAIVGGLFSLL
jgi:hypothetical protein